EPFVARALALVEGLEAARIVRRQPELGGTVVVRRAQPAVHRRADVAGLLRLVAAPVVPVRDPQPLDMPAFQVGLHAARGLEAFAHRAAALLRLAERAAELVREEEVFRPVMPAKGFVLHWGTKPIAFTSLPYLS